MDHIQSRESDFEVDLESGGTTSDEDGNYNYDLTGEISNKESYKAGSGFRGVQSCNGSVRNQDGSSTYNKILSADELSSVRRTEIWSNKVKEEMENLGDKKMNIEKTRKPKPPKPPRPPKGPSLDASDAKFVKEISELAIWKRRRTERMKALKKIKKESGSSSRMNILATVITILFFLIIIFQGVLGSRV
ncbi:uncharacterized protein LOC125867129 [Solanum stenotomum]|uniref:uncharacterized protein LOC125867129 n=1 Tax=Solanum stenotomum TaxID=172797 RepID=UPI0020D1496A|nr:uncharacterized protein LOC125867129 [Solanum stenotomum]XP_049403525.1 uncharacterized protein LOC125867129 [Solanum stenotomum]